MTNNHLANISAFEQLQNQANTSFNNSQMNAFQSNTSIHNVVLKESRKLEPNEHKIINDIKKSIESLEQNYKKETSQIFENIKQANENEQKIRKQIDGTTKEKQKLLKQLETINAKETDINQATNEMIETKVKLKKQAETTQTTFEKNVKPLQLKLKEYGVTVDKFDI